MATRARNATLTYGLLTLNVKLSSAKDKAPSMKNLCVGQDGQAHEPTPVRQPNTCDHCGPVSYDEIVKGMPNDAGGFTLQTQEEVADAKEEFTGQYKRALNFVPHPTTDILEQTAPGKSLNYIRPADVGGESIYHLLLHLVTKRPDVTLATLHTPVSATNLFILTTRSGVLALEERTHGDMLREVEPVDGEANMALYPMLEASTDAMLTPYDPADYEDGYTKHLKALAEQTENVTAITDAPSAKVDEVADIAAKLQAMMAGAA